MRGTALQPPVSLWNGLCPSMVLLPLPQRWWPTVKNCKDSRLSESVLGSWSWGGIGFLQPLTSLSTPLRLPQHNREQASARLLWWVTRGSMGPFGALGYMYAYKTQSSPLRKIKIKTKTSYPTHPSEGLK